jgi:dihydrofolate reductase
MISLIVAVDENNGMGYNNKLPWHLPEDLLYFREKTLGQVVVMGRKTHESIGRALPNRFNIVLTRQATVAFDEKAYPVKSIEDILEVDKAVGREIFIIGGAQIYEQFLPHADKIYLTKINKSFRADTYFPSLDIDEWEIQSIIPGSPDAQYDHEFMTFERRKKEEL